MPIIESDTESEIENEPNTEDFLSTFIEDDLQLDEEVASTSKLNESQSSNMPDEGDSFGPQTRNTLENLSPFESPINKQLEAIEKRQKHYLEWKKFIEGKLKQSGNQDFDIHEYETNIIETFPESKQMNFDVVLAGKSSSEVTKYFIASLQLANNYNIELSHDNSGVLCNGGIEMKLLSTDRHHEHLEEYQAPSEEVYASKLAQVQAMQSNGFAHSTPCVESSDSKKPRNRTYYSKKRKLCYSDDSC